MSVGIEKELVSLRRAILSMGASVEDRVSDALSAFANHDAEAAQVVRRGDSEIDRMEVNIETECVRVLALCHPVASDLRLVLAVLRINNDLERIGDLAKSLSKRVIDMVEAIQVDLPAEIHRMATRTSAMLNDALLALSDNDPKLAQKVRVADQEVDDLQRDIFAWAQREIPEHTDWTRGVIDVISIARALERIADHATNIAEDVIFMIDGAVVRHTRV